MKPFFLLCFAICFNNLSAQQLNKSINTDSLFKELIKNIPDDRKQEFIDSYNSGSEQNKAGILFVLSMPKSSKKELIANVKANYEQINLLKSRYAKLVPRNYTVSIEFEPENRIFNIKESIDLKITAIKNKETTVTQDWQLDPDGEKLNKMLKIVSWNKETLKTIKRLLIEAHCISIENGKNTEIGFARSGLGMYSYLLFDQPLGERQKQVYNDSCRYIPYNNSVLLEYEGGAAGPQCFPDRD